MSEDKFSGGFPTRNFPNELGFRAFQGTDCGWTACCRNSPHFHCRFCGYGTSQAANLIAHRRICIPNSNLQKDTSGRLTPSNDTNLMQHEVPQSTQSYSYYSTSNSSVSGQSHTSNTSGSANSKVTTTQQSPMFNFVIPGQNPQYSSLYGSQTVFPNSNLFSPSAYNNFGQLDPSWLPQSRLIPPNAHSSNSTSDLSRNHSDPTNTQSHSSCGRAGNVDNTNVGMCPPLTTEPYKVITKEFQSKIDTQNGYPQGIMAPTSSCKLSGSVVSSSINLLLSDHNDLKQGEDCMNVGDLCFDAKNDLKSKDPNSYMDNLDAFTGESSERKDSTIENKSEENNTTGKKRGKTVITCLVCSKVAKTAKDFVKISKKAPLTSVTHVSIFSKLTQVINDEIFNKLKNSSICPRCLNLINVVDQLEFRLKSAKKELISIYKTKDSEDSENQAKLSPFEQDKLTCQVCDKQFSSINYLEKHKQYHTNKYSYYCEYCGKGFAVLQKLENHLILHSNSSRFQCELCGKRFIQKHCLSDHLKKHKGEYRYRCTICHKGFIRSSVYKTHLLIHKSKSFMCHYCGKQFKNVANLTVHIKICSGDLKFSCDQCEKKFPLKSLLAKHIAIIHEAMFPFVCHLCRKGFGKKSDLKMHMRSHFDSKPYKCSKCSSTYKTLSNLNQHMKIHSASKVLECTICKKTFTRMDVLKDHMNLHTGNKPYKCLTCWKAFANRINFNNHTKEHNGMLKRTPCPICGKSFTKGLKEHLTSHTGEKPFNCNLCTAIFSLKSSLNRHMKTKHDNSNQASNQVNQTNQTNEVTS